MSKYFTYAYCYQPILSKGAVLMMTLSYMIGTLNLLIGTGFGLPYQGLRISRGSIFLKMMMINIFFRIGGPLFDE